MIPSLVRRRSLKPVGWAPGEGWGGRRGRSAQRLLADPAGPWNVGRVMTAHVLVALHPQANPPPASVAEPPPIPRFQTPGSAGMDLLAWIPAPVTLAPLGRARVPTGVCLAIPPGYEGQVRPRSGLAASHGVTVLNAPGTIDADYRGEVAVLLVNLGDQPFTVQRGDRVAQLVVAPVAHPVELEVVHALDATPRGQGGLGSTGMT